MLFRERDHQPIEQGRITMTVRAWRRPQARGGGAYRLHPRGVVVVDRLDLVRRERLTHDDARRCGYPSVEALLDDLAAASEGRPPVEELTRIVFHYEPQADERTLLAADGALDDEALAALATRLERMDRSARGGKWTLDTLAAIEARPFVVSTDLAAALNRDRQALKTDVRKLKRLGLTISHEIGYELSPRGRALLGYVRAR